MSSLESSIQLGLNHFVVYFLRGLSRLRRTTARGTESLLEGRQRGPGTKSLLRFKRRIIRRHVVPVLDQLVAIDRDHDDG